MRSLISRYPDPLSSGYRSSVPRGPDRSGGTVQGRIKAVWTTGTAWPFLTSLFIMLCTTQWSFMDEHSLSNILHYNTHWSYNGMKLVYLKYIANNCGWHQSFGSSNFALICLHHYCLYHRNIPLKCVQMYIVHSEIVHIHDIKMNTFSSWHYTCNHYRHNTPCNSHFYKYIV